MIDEEDKDNPFLVEAERQINKTLKRRAYEQVKRRERFAEVGTPILDEVGHAGRTVNVQMPDGRRAAYFRISMPPSMNNIWNHIGDRRVRTEAYDKWKRQAGWEIRAQKVLPFKNLVRVDISVERLHHGSDIDNRIKPVLDLLQDLHIFENDSIVVDVRCRWFNTRGGARIVITEVTEAEREHARVLDKATLAKRRNLPLADLHKLEK